MLPALITSTVADYSRRRYVLCLPSRFCSTGTHAHTPNPKPCKRNDNFSEQRRSPSDLVSTALLLPFRYLSWQRSFLPDPHVPALANKHTVSDAARLQRSV